MQTLDYIIIGGGIIGLAIGAALRPFGSVAVLEQHPLLIHETSSRNSQVIHAGIYYPQDSLKTRLCMAGNANIWRWQEKYPGVLRARRVGKWIGTCAGDGSVSADEEHVLERLIANMRVRGIKHEMVSAAEQERLEPLVRMGTVVHSVDTGIVDVASLRDAFVGIIEGLTHATHDSGGSDTDRSGYIARCAAVERVDLAGGSTSREHNAHAILTVRQTDAKDETFHLAARKAVICAVGLHGNDLWCKLYAYGSRLLRPPPSHRLHFCKGRYTAFRGPKAPVHRLVYPCPLPRLVGLGVHATVDLSGAVRFGPDAIYTDSPNDYSFMEGLADATPQKDQVDERERFVDRQYAAVKRYLPLIERARLTPDYVGIRPKLAGPGEGFRDFLLEEVIGLEEGVKDDGSPCVPRMQKVSGKPCGGSSANRDTCRLLMATGIESPGLTASTAIAEFIARSLASSDEEYSAHLPPWSASAEK